MQSIKTRPPTVSLFLAISVLFREKLFRRSCEVASESSYFLLLHSLFRYLKWPVIAGIAHRKHSNGGGNLDEVTLTALKSKRLYLTPEMRDKLAALTYLIPRWGHFATNQADRRFVRLTSFFQKWASCDGVDE